MIQNVTVTSQQQGMPGYYQIIVKAQVIPPSPGAMLSGSPQATLQSGGMSMGPIGMNSDPNVANGWIANFGGAANTYTAGVSATWTVMAQTAESGNSSPTPVP